jgi:hypothetical protein
MMALVIYSIDKSGFISIGDNLGLKTEAAYLKHKRQIAEEYFGHDLDVAKQFGTKADVKQALKDIKEGTFGINFVCKEELMGWPTPYMNVYSNGCWEFGVGVEVEVEA